MACRWRCIFSLLTVLAAGSFGFGLPMSPPSACRAEEPSRPSFSSIVAEGTRKTFDAVLAYVKQNADAPDRERAYRWLFETSRQQGWESDALPFADQYLTGDAEGRPHRTLAMQVRVVGLARNGNADSALTAFDEAIAAVSLRMPNEALDLAVAAASALQTSGKGTSAKEVYERLSRRFFLNPAVRTFCENRLGKLELLGKPAPALGIEDLEGKAPSLEDFRGRLVLIDFWATNCAPCLEEFPMLKQLHADNHRRGFDVLGISLDEGRETVDAFQERAKLPWRLALSQTDRDATRERFRVVTIPSMFLVDEQGKIVCVDVRGEELKRIVERRLSGSSERPSR